MTRYLGITQAKAHLADFGRSDEPIVLIRNSKPVAVVLSVAEYDRLLGALEFLKQPELRHQVEAATEDFESRARSAFQAADAKTGRLVVEKEPSAVPQAAALPVVEFEVDDEAGSLARLLVTRIKLYNEQAAETRHVVDALKERVRHLEELVEESQTPKPRPSSTSEHARP